MIKIKQYIKNNKQLLLIYAIMALFLIIQNKVYCMPGFFLPAITYFSGISPEFWANKAIDSLIFYSPLIYNKTIEYAPIITFYTGAFTLCSFGGVGLLYTGEFIYNRNYIINKYLESTPIVGHALKGYKYLFVKEQTNPQYVHVVKDLVNYIGLLPKPKIEIREVEKLVVQTIEKPVVSYRDRPQLLFLHNKLDSIEQSVVFINDNSNFYNIITQEMQKLDVLSNQSRFSDEIFVAQNQEIARFLSNILKIEYKYADFSVPMRTTVGTIIRTFQNPNLAMARIYGYQDPFEVRLFAHYSEQNNVQLDLEKFKEAYPKIFLLLERKALAVRGVDPHKEVSMCLNVGYKNTGRGFLSSQKIDPNLFTIEFVENGNNVIKPILPEIEAFFDISMRAEKEILQHLIAEVRGFILDNTNSEIDEYLAQRLQTDVLINKSKDLMELDLYVKAKRERPVNYRAQESVTIQDNNLTPMPVENVDVINPISTIVQNPLMMFAAALSTFVVYDFHNIELAAQMLLGFTKVPGWDNTFLELSRMSLAELQTTYNLTQPGAEKARQIIDYASNLRENNLLANQNTNTLSTAFPLDKVIYVGGALLIGVGIIGLGCLYIKSIQNGMPAQEVTPIINNISPSIQEWSSSILNEIDKL